jgi:hypothetical protein
MIRRRIMDNLFAAVAAVAFAVLVAEWKVLVFRAQTKKARK